jgi:hypothetical protein
MARRIFPPPTMKTKFALFAACLAAATTLAAAPLTATTAVYARPSETAAIVSYLKAGAEPVPAANALATTPAGWMAVDLAGPFEAYVQNKDIGKSLDILPGSSLHQQPKIESGVIATMEKGDKVEITGLRGKWTQVKLDKKLVGFIRLPGAAPIIALPPLAEGRTVTPAPAPVAPPAPVYSSAGPGQPAPTANLGDGGSSALPRSFQGKFVSTKRPFAPKRPYDFQLNDDAGVRYAYVDLSKLLLTDAIEKYLDHVVVVFGTAKNVPNTRDIVIEVESLQLK